MRHYQVDELGDVLLGGTLANQEPYMLEGIGRPRHQDQKTDKNGTNRIGIPLHSATNNGHHQTESIDRNVVSMVDKEDMNGRVSPVYETEDTQASLAKDWRGHCKPASGMEYKEWTTYLQ